MPCNGVLDAESHHATVNVEETVSTSFNQDVEEDCKWACQQSCQLEEGSVDPTAGAEVRKSDGRQRISRLTFGTFIIRTHLPSRGSRTEVGFHLGNRECVEYVRGPINRARKDREKGLEIFVSEKATLVITPTNIVHAQVD